MTKRLAVIRLPGFWFSRLKQLHQLLMILPKAIANYAKPKLERSFSASYSHSYCLMFSLYPLEAGKINQTSSLKYNSSSITWMRQEIASTISPYEVIIEYPLRQILTEILPNL